MTAKMGVLGYSDYVGLRQLRRFVGSRRLSCSGVELGLSWIAWYEGNIVVDGYAQEADRLYEYPWRVTSLLRSGVCVLKGVNVTDLEYVVLGDRLFRKIVDDWESENVNDECLHENDSAIYMNRDDVRSLWSRSKGGKKRANGGLLDGPGSYRRFVVVLMLLGYVDLIEGALGGEVGAGKWALGCELGDLYKFVWFLEDDLRGVGVHHSYQEEFWYAMLLFSEETDDHSRADYCRWKCGDESADDEVSPEVCVDSVSVGDSNGSSSSEVLGSVDVYVSLYCGTQSDREEAEAYGCVYIGLDLVSEIYSSVLGRWVRCVECDVDGLDAESLGILVRQHLDSHGYRGTSYNIVHIGASPVCKSFSRADSCNRERGCGYRDHRDAERPPLTVAKGGSVIKCALAVAADKSVQHLAELLLDVCSRYTGCTYHVENPFGSLQYRPYHRCEVRNTRIENVLLSGSA